MGDNDDKSHSSVEPKFFSSDKLMREKPNENGPKQPAKDLDDAIGSPNEEAKVEDEKKEEENNAAPVGVVQA